jgi:hypothetical protein
MGLPALSMILPLNTVCAVTSIPAKDSRIVNAEAFDNIFDMYII